jgi:hypothetical protein
MTHLTPEQFIDLVDGAQVEAQAPHLSQCAACRATLTELRAAAGAALDDVVPEPSPLFWEHLSARVQAAVAAEPDRRVPGWMTAWSPWRFGATAAAAIALAAIVAVAPGRFSSEPRPPLALSDAAPVAGGAESVVPEVDPSMQLVADLAAELDWEAALDAGLGARAGAVQRLVPELSAAERLELQRLLQEELMRSGA